MERQRTVSYIKANIGFYTFIFYDIIILLTQNSSQLTLPYRRFAAYYTRKPEAFEVALRNRKRYHTRRRTDVRNKSEQY